MTDHKPDSGIKKVIVPQANVGAMYTGSNSINKYLVRYRIVADKGSDVSNWSQIYSIDAATVLGNGIADGYTVISNGTSMTVSWKLDSNTYGATFDAYARWNESSIRPDEQDSGWSEWMFVAEASLSSFSVKIPTNKKWVEFYLQRKTFPQAKTDAAKVFQTSIYPTRSTTDGGLLTQQ